MTQEEFDRLCMVETQINFIIDNIREVEANVCSGCYDLLLDIQVRLMDMSDEIFHKSFEGLNIIISDEYESLQ